MLEDFSVCVLYHIKIHLFITFRPYCTVLWDVTFETYASHFDVLLYEFI